MNKNISREKLLLNILLTCCLNLYNVLSWNLYFKNLIFKMSVLYSLFDVELNFLFVSRICMNYIPAHTSTRLVIALSDIIIFIYDE